MCGRFLRINILSTLTSTEFSRFWMKSCLDFVTVWFKLFIINELSDLIERKVRIVYTAELQPEVNIGPM